MSKLTRAGRTALQTPTPIEIALDESEMAALLHATSTLRWWLAKTASGWSHAAVDPAECERWGERLEAIAYEARDQLKESKTAMVSVTEADAVLLRQFIALVKRVEPDGFAALVRELGQIATTIEPLNRRPSQRRRRSGLSEP